MKRLCNFGIVALSLLFPASCATRRPPVPIVAASVLPPDIAMNKEAGRGNWLFLMIRVEGGEELPFFVDTGLSFTLLDKSLEPRLGNPLGTNWFRHFEEKVESARYAAPKLYLGGVPLMIGSNIHTADLAQPSSYAGRPIMGVLGMDCLKHYSVQLDFESGTLKFLAAGDAKTAELGTAFPLTYHWNCPFIRHSSLAGGKRTDIMIDTGCYPDGHLPRPVFEEEGTKGNLRIQAKHVEGHEPHRALLPVSAWNGSKYTNLFIGNKGNLIGLRFLARHLVTFDFPRRTMYLKQRSVGPLPDESMKAALAHLNLLREQGQVPGWPKSDDRTVDLEAHPNSETYDFRKEESSAACHYRIARANKESPWTLRKAWRTNQNNETVEDYSLK